LRSNLTERISFDLLGSYNYSNKNLSALPDRNNVIFETKLHYKFDSNSSLFITAKSDRYGVGFRYSY